jgi:hypothetical protein
MADDLHFTPLVRDGGTQENGENGMRALQLSIAAGLTFALAGCEAIGTIFRAGMWVGVFVVLVVLAGVWFLVSRFR